MGENDKRSPFDVWQIGLVVRDLDAAVRAYHQALGWGPWSIWTYEPPRNHDTFLRGRPVEYSMKVAETNLGSIAFELIEPLEGPSIYREFLDQHGEGLHHIACTGPSQDYAENLRFFETLGYEVVMGGRIGTDVQYCYLEAAPLQIVLESGVGPGVPPDRTYP